MSEEDIPWSTLILRTIEEAIEDVGVSMPGNVVSYDRATQTARIKLGLTKRVASYTDFDETFFEDLPDMFNVPVIWPGGDGSGTGSSFFHPSLEAGEGVLLVCSDADFSRWLKAGRKSNPFDARMHHYSKCVAIPGFRPKADRLASSAVVLAAGGTTKSVALAEPLWEALKTFTTSLGGATDPVVANAANALTTALGTLAPSFASSYIKTGG